MTVQMLDFETAEVWKDIKSLLCAHPQTVNFFKSELDRAKFNAVAEVRQGIVVLFEERANLKVGDVVFSGTRLAEGLAMTFMGEAKEGLLLGTITLEEELNKYQKARLLSPNNVTAIRGVAECLLDNEDYNGAIEMFVRLASVAEKSQDLNLAQYVLDQPVVENVLLNIKPMPTATLKPADVVPLFA